MKRPGQELAVSISPDSVSSVRLAQPDCQPNPRRFRTLNQGGNVLRPGAGVSRFLSAEMREVRGRVAKAGLANLILPSDTVCPKLGLLWGRWVHITFGLTIW